MGTFTEGDGVGTNTMTDSSPSEDAVRFSGRTHAKILAGPVVIQAVVLVMHVLVHEKLPAFGWAQVDDHLPMVLHSILVLIQLIYVTVPALRWVMTKFTVTDDSVRMSSGVLRRATREIHIAQVTQVEMERNLLDYLFGCGTIILHEASASEPVRMVDVPHVVLAKRHIDELLRESRSARTPRF